MPPTSAQPSAALPTPPPAAPLRLRHIDSLRAVAAGSVMWTHFAESLQPISASGPAFLGFLFTLPPYVNLGRIGVMIFFAVSGFVICRSFGGPREGGTRRFLIRRVCRLYPAFWVSMLAGMLLWRMDGKALTWPLVTATATMLPGRFGQPLLIGVYWTLEIELLFYALCLGLYRAGWLGRGGVLGALALGFATVPRAVHRVGKWMGILHLTLPGEGGVWMISLAVMFWGAAFRLVYDATGGFRRGVFTQRGPWLLALLTLALIDLHDPHLKHVLREGPLAPWLVEMGSVVGIVTFTVWVAALRVDNRPLSFLGVISYSLYLFHPVVLYLVLPVIVRAENGGMTPPPLWAAMALCTALTVALSTATYRWVEQPAIALGKRWVGAAGREASAPPAGTTSVG